MKIRTGFVTNSSSYSSAAVSIQSQEIADLIRRYHTEHEELFLSCLRVLNKDDQTSGNPFTPDVYVVIKGDWVLASMHESASGWDRVPEKLNQVLDALIWGLGHVANSDGNNDEILEALQQEANSRRKELTDSIQSVEWEFNDGSYDEFVYDGMLLNAEFHYERGAEGALGQSGEYSEYRPATSVTLTIQSKAFVALLKEYKDLIGPNSFMRGQLKRDTFSAEWDCDSILSWCTDVPETLDLVIERLLTGMTEALEDMEEPESVRFQALIQALTDRKQELTDSFQEVSWVYECANFDDFEPYTDTTSFTYSKQDGGTGVYECE